MVPAHGGVDGQSSHHDTGGVDRAGSRDDRGFGGHVFVEPLRSPSDPVSDAATIWAYFGHMAAAPAADETTAALTIEPSVVTGGGTGGVDPAPVGDPHGDPLIVWAYSAGYLAAGWRADLLEHFKLVVGGPTAACPSGESGWQIDPPGFHLGLSQFNPDSWNRVASVTGYWDWRDPWQHGYNVAVWASMTDYPNQWSCW